MINQVDGREREYDDWWDPYQPPQQTTAPPTTVAPPTVTPPGTGGTTNTNNPPPGTRRTSRPGFYEEWDGTKWVEYSDPSWKGTPTDGGTTDGGGGDDLFNFDGMTLPATAWEQFDPKRFAHPEFGGFTPFEFKTFNAPTLEQAENNPGYKFAKEQMLGTLKNSYAGRGLARTPNAYNAYLENVNNLAEQNYGNVFNRERDTFGMNEGNRFQAWGANNNNLLTTWNTNKDLALDIFDREYKGDYDAFSFRRDAQKTDANTALQQWLAKVNAATVASRPVE